MGEADARTYAKTFGEVAMDEVVNARDLDDLYERLFMATRMDALDQVFLSFLWGNHTSSLRAPGGVWSGAPINIPAMPRLGIQGAVLRSPLHSMDSNGKRLRAIIRKLSKYTTIYQQWKGPIE